MGNCQAIDNATLVIQQPSGRVDKLYSPVLATDIMKMYPGHYVALLLTTTLYPSAATATATAAASATTTNNEPLRITRIKLLRPTDTLVLGHTYRLISAQEVMKGLWAKKYAKMQKKQSESSGREEKTSSDLHAVAATRYELEKKPKQVIKHDRHRPRASLSTNSSSSSTNSASSSSSTTAKSRGWHPSLQSISEARS